eukprot:CAMPEP_0174314172 /NCGR_PEP_ID=MMETSP0810-20121108/5473_1 /TAXON_ID=73025 ORGANISM="Eutreptiella gymnastica-like, Strain CCMP1594" /NCGR_SAMPLE_ID=MMETSP0810 /ASSEMBLY_ACC=CAM_ASM_000659 /LENGTH=154 /DNA_ID=CAMNT_0015423197 /DNA_START=1723 /DNA_END=2188 /DNA_ORIENTATION=+
MSKGGIIVETGLGMGRDAASTGSGMACGAGFFGDFAALRARCFVALAPWLWLLFREDERFFGLSCLVSFPSSFVSGGPASEAPIDFQKPLLAHQHIPRLPGPGRKLHLLGHALGQALHSLQVRALTLKVARAQPLPQNHSVPLARALAAAWPLV